MVARGVISRELVDMNPLKGQEKYFSVAECNSLVLEIKAPFIFSKGELIFKELINL